MLWKWIFAPSASTVERRSLSCIFAISTLGFACQPPWNWVERTLKLLHSAKNCPRNVRADTVENERVPKSTLKRILPLCLRCISSQYIMTYVAKLDGVNLCSVTCNYGSASVFLHQTCVAASLWGQLFMLWPKYSLLQVFERDKPKNCNSGEKFGLNFASLVHLESGTVEHGTVEHGTVGRTVEASHRRSGNSKRRSRDLSEYI